MGNQASGRVKTGFGKFFLRDQGADFVSLDMFRVFGDLLENSEKNDMLYMMQIRHIVSDLLRFLVKIDSNVSCA